jgi:DnaJ-class molecular chaperone
LRKEAFQMMGKQPRKEVCSNCRGTGKTFKNTSIYDWGWKICEQCNGKGFIEIPNIQI